ncbi:MAG: DNA polymerase III subunit delta [Spirochaetia bacterium]|nr:DNA polymerase III subunit delta [Spirochaetia bacterium]
MAQNYIKTDRLNNCYVLAGADDFFRAEFVRELLETFLTGKVDDSSIEKYDVSDDNSVRVVNSIIESASTPPFFSEKKFILVTNFMDFKKDELSQLAAFTGAVPDCTVLVLASEMPAKKLMDAGIASKLIINLSASDASDIKDWTIEYLKTQGKKISPEVLNYVVAESNGEPAVVKNEIDKALLFIGNREEICMDDFLKTRGVEKGYTLDDLTEAIADMDENRTFLIFEKLFENTAPEQMLGFIFYQIKKLYIFRYFLRTGEVNKAFKYVFAKDVDKVKRQSKNFANVPYADMLNIIAEADRRVKLSNRDRAKTILFVMLQKIFLRAEGKNF